VHVIKTKGYGEAPVVMVLAHGAGAPMDSPFMNLLAESLEEEGIASLRFEFPYMQKRREDGKKRPPDRQPGLLESYQQMVAQVRHELGPGTDVILGGKSMGGRMASILATDAAVDVRAVVCYGYPFHPPGKPGRWRTDHLPDLVCPLLVLQGTRDPFGKPAELQARGPIDGIHTLEWLDGGDHDFRPPVRHPETQESLIRRAAALTRAFVEGVDQPVRASDFVPER